MKKAVRVLQIVTTMNRGGLETMLINYDRKIDHQKVQFDFVEHCQERSDYDDEIERLGGRIYRVPALIPWSRRYKAALGEIFAQHPEYRIVHVHQDCLSSVALKVARDAGIPVRIAHSHAAGQDKNLKYPIKLFYKRFIPRYATDLLACGREAGDWMFGGANYQILNNAIPAGDYTFDPERREHTRRQLGLQDEFTVGLVGSFCPQKNHTYLLDVFHALIQREPEAKLLLVGDGRLRGMLERKIRDLGLSGQVILTGVRADVSDLLQAMDVFVMPSNYEGLSMAVVEAQAAGLPCFISDRVSLECRITDLVRQIPLAAPPENWAREILSVRGMERRNTCREILQAGFDIDSNVEGLQEFYLRKAGSGWQH